MRGNIIEELYYGNVDPQDHGYHPKSPVKKASDSLNDLEEKLTEQLAGENKALFLRFCNAYAEFMGESELDTFITGFRLGARYLALCIACTSHFRQRQIDQLLCAQVSPLSLRRLHSCPLWWVPYCCLIRLRQSRQFQLYR